MSKHTLLIAAGLFACLTICQFASAQGSSGRGQGNKPLPAKKASAAPRASKSRVTSPVRPVGSAADTRMQKVSATVPAPVPPPQPAPRFELMDPSSVAQPAAKMSTSKSRRSAPSIDPIETEMMEAELVGYDASAELERDAWRDEGIAGTAKSVNLPIPRNREIIADISGDGRNVTIAGTVLDQGIRANLRSETQGFISTVRASFGLTNSIYLGAGADFGTSTATERRTGGMSTSAEQKVITEGVAEPEIFAGAHALLGSTRVIGELSGRIPVGPSRQNIRLNETRSDLFSGGGSLSPKLGVVSDMSWVKLIGIAQYEYRLDRDIETTGAVSGGAFNASMFGATSGTINEVQTGGNTWRGTLGFELPRLFNAGMFGFYSRTEDSQVRDTRFNDLAARTSPGSSVAGGAIYAGVPLTSDAFLVPRVMYSNVLERNIGTSTLNTAEAWTFGLAGRFGF